MSHVNLVLVESIHGLGEAGELVRVKPGYARNYLLPQGKALLATESRVKELEHKRRIAEERAARELGDLKAVKKQLEGLAIEIGARAGESGKLFGSVTAPQIAERIEAAGIAIDRRRIALGEPIKEVGEHEITVKLRSDVVAALRVTVVAEAGPVQDDDDLEAGEDRHEGRRRSRRDDDEDDGEERDSDEEAAADA